MDDIDHKILEILRENSRTSNSEIAAKVRLTEGAVRNRIKRLLEEGIIKRFTIETERDQVEAIVLIKTRTKASREILRKIRKHSDRLFETAGEYDVAAYVTAKDIQDVNTTIDHVRAIEGVISTVTLLKIAEDQSSA